MDNKIIAEKVIAIAKAEVNYNSYLTDGYTKYIKDINEKYPNWYNNKKNNNLKFCNVFIDWCFLIAFGYEKALDLLCKNEKSVSTGSVHSYFSYKKKNQTGKTPKVGAQIFFGRNENNLNNTGLVYKIDDSYIYTIEGNALNKVVYCQYDKKISDFWYGYPKYDEDINKKEIIQTEEKEIIQTEEKEKKDNALIKENNNQDKFFNQEIARKYITTSKLNLRAGAGLSEKILTVIAKGDQIICEGYYIGNWYYVQYGNYKGFCLKNWLK